MGWRMSNKYIEYRKTLILVCSSRITSTRYYALNKEDSINAIIWKSTYVLHKKATWNDEIQTEIIKI